MGSEEPPEGFKQDGDITLHPARGPGTGEEGSICSQPVVEDLVADSPQGLAWPLLGLASACLGPGARGGARGAGRLSPDD